MTKLEKLYSIIENSREVGVKLSVFEDRHKRRYYRYADGMESIYDRICHREVSDI